MKPVYKAQTGKGSMNRLGRVALVCAAIMMSSCSSGQVAPLTTTAAVATTTTATTTTRAETTTEPVESIPTLQNMSEEDLQPGTYLLDFQARGFKGGFPQVVLTVPDGWANQDGWLVGIGRGTSRNMFVSFWDVKKVYAHPCSWSSEPLVDPGPTVEGLVAALVDQPLRNATTPVEVIVDGHEGFMLEWSVPTDVDFSTCDEGFFESWTALGWSSDRYQQGPSQVDRLWILDIDGSRLVIDAAYMPGTTEQDREELFAVVDSIQFRPVKGG